MVAADVTRVTDWIDVDGDISRGSNGYVMSGRLNDSFKAMNLLFHAGVSMRRVDEAMGALQPGDFLVSADAPSGVLAEVAAETGVDFHPLDADAAAVSHPIEAQRIGMFQRYYGGNMDEGWTRWLLEDFEFPYTSIMSERMREGDLRSDFDVIILPDDGMAMMTGELGEGGGRGRGPDPSEDPPQYRSGFGSEGVAALEEFVEQGGTLVTFARAGDLPIERFELPVRNAVAGMGGNDFWSPGSSLRITVDPAHPAAYGMPGNALATFLQGSQVYETVAGPNSANVTRVASYVERDVLESGWLLGEDAIAGKAAVVAVKHGEGQVVLLGFRAQHRAQTHGTFKFLFNALVSGPAETMVMQ